MVGYTQQPVSYQRPPRNPEQKKSPWGDAGLPEIYEDLLNMPHTPEGIAKLQEYTQHEPPVSTLAGMVISNRNRILDASKQPPTSTVAQQNYEQAMASVQAPQAPQGEQVAGIGGAGIPVDPNTPSGVADGVGALGRPQPQPIGSGVGRLSAEQLVAGGGLIELAGGGEVIPFQNTGRVPDLTGRYDPLSGWRSLDPYDPIRGRPLDTLSLEDLVIEQVELITLNVKLKLLKQRKKKKVIENN